MKKTLSIFLAIIMLLSCFTAFTANAASGDIADMLYTEESIAASADALRRLKINGLEQFDFDFEERKEGSNAAVWNKVSLLGLNLDYLYSADSNFVWSQLDIYQKNEDGSIKYDSNKNPVVAITMDDISLAFTNISIYLQRVFYKVYSGLDLYNVNNAISLANAIGKAIKPDFKTLDVNNYKNYFTNEIPSANEFFDAVTTLSGLGDVVAQNWIPRGKSFCEPVVKLLGSEYINFVNDYYTDGHKLASKMLEGAVAKINTVGVVEFIFDILDAFTTESYSLVYCEPVLALFSLKIASLSEYMTEGELKSVDGLLHLIFCDCDPVSGSGCYGGSSAVDHFSPFKFPVERFRRTTDRNEKILYLYYYLNLCGHYKNNSEYFRNLKRSISNSVLIYSADQIKLRALVDGFFLGDFDSAIDDAIVPLYKENISSADATFLDRIGNAFSVFMKKIADFFDYLRKLFSGEIQYGQGNSPFN